MILSEKKDYFLELLSQIDVCNSGGLCYLCGTD
jgi:hypothetical protein